MSSVISMSFDLLRAASADDNKYSRGVLGFLTGSVEFPGAAILGVSAAIRTGVGLVRFLGSEQVASSVMLVRPETVTQDGKVDAWVLGSGVAASSVQELAAISSIIESDHEHPLVIDAGALTLVSKGLFVGRLAILTPHLGEAKKLAIAVGAQFNVDDSQASELAQFIAQQTGATVILKGHESLVVDVDFCESQPPAPSVLATAGTGDVLAGILGALCAINRKSIAAGEVSLIQVAKSAIAVHSLAAEIASMGAPIAALDVADAVGQAIARLRVQ